MLSAHTAVIKKVGGGPRRDTVDQTVPTMSEGPIDEAVVHGDGWFVIRNTENPEQWLAIDESVDVRR